MKKRILGLDTGTNSLGWAVVDKFDDNTYQLVRRGVLLFQEGVKIEKGIESSKAAERTVHRSLRKQYFRRRLRKIEVLKVLVRNYLCPYISDEALHEWHVHKVYPKTDDFMLWQRTNDNELKNPYYYRYRCLTERLDMDVNADRYVLGRALYHLAQRRGFLSNRLDSSEDEKENGKVQTGISDLSKAIQEKGCHYLGAYFYKLYAEQGNTVRIRTRYTDREEHYKKEFYAICKKQRLDKSLIEDLEKALYFQRPLKSQQQGVGKCTFEPQKTRCAVSHPAFEEFRMLQLLNSVKVKGPYDVELRPLNQEERERALPKFFRKSANNFDFEDIAKAIAGRNNYSFIKDADEKPYKFNFRMSQGVSGCPFTAQLRAIFGDNWKESIAETYTMIKKSNGIKTLDEVVNDVWNVLYSFSSKDKLKEFAINRLQLDEEKATKFSEIKLNRGFASLSLKALNKILPFLREGYIYSHAVALANIPSIVSEEVWEDNQQREFIISNVNELINNFDTKDKSLQGTMDFCIKDFLKNNFDLKAGATDKLYHPSMIETYQDAKTNKDGVYQLGSPRTNAIRNPMAMRSLHELRKVINQLLREKVIDNTTEVHVEYARELNDANKRKAIADYQKKLDHQRKKYRDEIAKFYKEAGYDIEPSERDILKFQLWEEQGHRNIYGDEEIGIADFLGTHPKYDIEHTIPRSVGGDSTRENMTLCDVDFNRKVKGKKLPSQLANFEDILVRIAGWKEKIEELQRKMDDKRLRTFSGMAKAEKDKRLQEKWRLKLEYEYWKGKYSRFTMTEVPEGFSRRQGVGIGLISKYAGLYLKSLFHDHKDRNKSNVYVVKGKTTSEFRQMWGLQEEYEKKSRDNHVHHCIDAITIACIGKYDANLMSRYYHQLEDYESGQGPKPRFPKPWPTFTEDVLNIQQELLVVNDMPDNMPKKAKRRIKLEKRNRVVISQGDCARGSLHNDTYYGAIERDGEIRYVVRRELNKVAEKDVRTVVANIVDASVKEIVETAIQKNGSLKKAIEIGIWMNKEKGIKVNKVRCYADIGKGHVEIRQHRDLSEKKYKRAFHVNSGINYMMAIYERKENNTWERDYELVKMMDSALFYKKSTGREEYPQIVPYNKNNLPLKACLKKGSKVILWEKSPHEVDFSNLLDIKKRLYVVTGLSISTKQKKYVYGYIEMRHHQEARQSNELPKSTGIYKNEDDYRPVIIESHKQFSALVEGFDFEIDKLGNIKLLHHD